MLCVIILSSLIFLASAQFHSPERLSRRQRPNAPEVKAAFHEMHKLYCQKYNNMQKSICLLYFAKRNLDGSARSERGELPDSPPSREELEDMHALYCQEGGPGLDTYPCRRWLSRQS